MLVNKWEIQAIKMCIFIYHGTLQRWVESLIFFHSPNSTELKWLWYKDYTDYFDKLHLLGEQNIILYWKEMCFFPNVKYLIVKYLLV